LTYLSNCSPAAAAAADDDDDDDYYYYYKRYDLRDMSKRAA